MTKSKKEDTKTVAVKKKPPYHLEVTVNDTEFKTDAKDLETALTEFVQSPNFPVGAKTTAFIKFSKGDKDGKKIWHTPLARKMFNIISLKPDALKVLATQMETEIG